MMMTMIGAEMVLDYYVSLDKSLNDGAKVWETTHLNTILAH